MNPFSGYGSVVEPSRFIGRAREINAIKQRVLQNHAYGCSAIVGEARIGKTSLMYYPFRVRNKEGLEDRKIAVDMGSIARLHFSQPDDFFKHLIKHAHRKLEKHTHYNLGSLYESAILSPYFVTDTMFEYLQQVKEDGFRLIFLLDEFDGIERIFANAPESFQTLREMGYDYRWKVGFVVTSRLGIGQIEKTCGSISNLAGIFQDINLGLMSEADIRLLIESRLAETNINFTASEISEIIRLAGQHPFFVEMLGFYLFEEKTYGTESDDIVAAAVARSRGEFERNFNGFRDRLGIERFRHLVEAVLGFETDLNSRQELVRLGHLVEEHGEAGQVKRYPFSDIYRDYLAKYAKHLEKPVWLKDDDLWYLLKNTEKKLRELISTKLQQHYGSNWEQELERFARATNKYDDWIAARERELRNFRQYNETPVLPLIEYSYIGDLGVMICYSSWWNYFKVVFGEKQWVDEQIRTLSRVRNPQAHFRDDVIPENEVERARVSCRDLLMKIERA